MLHGPGGMGTPPQKVKDFKGTSKRLSRYLAPYKYRLITVLLTAILGTLFSILGPKILGEATTAVFEGVSEQIKGIPGAGIDFAYILRILIVLAGLYLFSSLFTFIQQFVMASVAKRRCMFCVRKQRRKYRDYRLPILTLRQRVKH